jgi:PPM family protein phosphatase
MAIEQTQADAAEEPVGSGLRRAAQTAPLRLEEEEATETAPAEESVPASEASVAEQVADPAQERAVGEPADDDAWWTSSAAESAGLPGTSIMQMSAPLLSNDAANPEGEPQGETGAGASEEVPAAAEAPQKSDNSYGTRYLADDAAPELRRVRSAQGWAAIAARDIGRVRSINQDSVFSLLTTLPREGGDVRMGLFIVADGMGGHEGGEIASRLAVRTVVYHVLAQLLMPALDDGPIEALQSLMVNAVQEANTTIWEQAQSQGTDMGTTCTAILLVGNGLYLAHVGDSRAYMHTPNGLRLLTTDHSTVGRLIAMGQLEASEAREHPLRNQLYRTVGQQPQINVDFVYEPVGDGSHLLLCSDGLWGLVDDALLVQALERNLWPQDACNELIALANLAGGEDNISAVVVSLPTAAGD